MYNIIGLKVKHPAKAAKDTDIDNPKPPKKKKSVTYKTKPFPVEKRNKSIDAHSALLKRQSEPKLRPKRKEDLILKTIEEDYRKGDFEKLFPLSTNVDKYKEFFDGSATINDRALWRWLKDPGSLPNAHIKVQHQSAV